MMFILKNINWGLEGNKSSNFNIGRAAFESPNIKKFLFVTDVNDFTCKVD